MRYVLNRLLLLPMLCWAAQVGAQSAEGDGTLQEGATDPVALAALTIATREAPPFAFKDADGQWSGIAIELWNQIAEQNGFDFHYTELGLTEMLDATATGSVDAAVAALTITSDREQDLDFSHPFHTSGLAVAVPHRSSNLLAVIARLMSPGFLVVVAALLALLVAVGVLIWLAERRKNDQFCRAPLSGIGSGLWWSAVTMTTVGYGDKAPMTPLGRLIGMVWMFSGLIAISTFTAAITTALTVNELDTSIKSVNDLRSKRVLALSGSTSDSFLAEQGVRHRTVGDLPAALTQMAEGKADAVVHDAPILRYAIAEAFAQQLQVLPLVLRRQDYGIALPPDSELRESANVALLEIIRSNDWLRLLDRYLGTEH
ncbi:transporter substrate-binding domain-containing protein [Thiorhodovibrio frisius]|uniref:Periplasmic component of amino acid ABC-type transporter/signal transduction system n=1 Tax=Thiorhodovibrio frisius TaxID=631362 RepID=H8Z398_9GAMM|nr:transporter substrate-binding domain-containing protein [Thiorhodovibrio frisius]EIC21806.1 periplasmic component of amino acid ABC-type transporter/signal transduction system [Thiorhodovibrio frisius]WPL21776.1 Glutamine-binding periplasmic protein precursor [Thiorhodovibrio frisius]